MSKSKRKQPPPIHLVLPPSLRRELEGFLVERSANGREAFAFLLCGRHRRRGLLRLLTRHVILPEDDCFDCRSGGAIECSRTFDEAVLALADEEGLTIVAVHTHVQLGQVEFSGVDDRCERERALAIFRTLGYRVGLASVVYDRNASYYCARLWHCHNDGAVASPMKIVSTIADDMTADEYAADSRFERQVQAFGGEFQHRLNNLRIGVVGVGGLGSLLVEGLAAMPFSQYTDG